MKTKRKIIAGMLALMMAATLTPVIVSAKTKVKAPAKVTVTSFKRTGSTKATVKWKKLKKSPSGYGVYVQSASRDKIGKWKLLKKTGKKTTSVTVKTSPENMYKVKVRAFKRGKKKSVKWGKYSSTKTLGVIFQNKITSLKGSFDTNENAALTWTRIIGAKKYQVYRSQGSGYKLIATLDGNAKNSYTDEHYNPTKTINYKVRPVTGIYTGSWSKVLTMRPQDITVPVGTKITEMNCFVCNRDVSDIGEQQLQDEHKIYYCSKCGINKFASHSHFDAIDHLRDVHKKKSEYYCCNVCKAKYHDDKRKDSTIAIHFYPHENNDTCNQDKNVVEEHVKNYKHDEKFIADKKIDGPKVIAVSYYDYEGADIKTASAKTYTKIINEITKPHKHCWKTETISAERVMKYKDEIEYHDFCRICGEDLNDLDKAFRNYIDSNGYTIDDDEFCNNEYYERLREHDYKDVDKYGIWGQYESNYVEVKVPIKKKITVNKYSCDCGASRTD